MNVLATLLQTIALVPSVVNGNRGPIQPPDKNEKKGCICRLQNASCSLHSASPLLVPSHQKCQCGRSEPGLSRAMANSTTATALSTASPR
jgi:hypothetical protein